MLCLFRSLIRCHRCSTNFAFIQKKAPTRNSKRSLESSFTSVSSIVNRNVKYNINNENNKNVDKSIENDIKSNTRQKINSQKTNLATSRVGLDPSTNRFHAPIVYHDNYSFDGWHKSHTFPMDKFKELANSLLTTCKRTDPKSSLLPRPLVREETDFYRPFDFHEIPIKEWISGPIDHNFLERFLKGKLTYEECRDIGFREQTNRPELIERTILEVAGTILTSQLAYRYGIASNAAGGTHHAHGEMGAGYTIINDLVVAANFILNEELNKKSIQGIKHVLVIDCDVHQGDGTSKCLDIIGRTKMSTFSIHCESNYPFSKANSTYDIGLQDGCDDETYMKILMDSINRAIDEVQPDFILYDAGVDVYIDDKLGRLKITENGIRRRDRYVLDTCVTMGIPVAAVIGGGYDKDVAALARRHAIVHEECAYVWRKHKMWNRILKF